MKLTVLWVAYDLKARVRSRRVFSWQGTSSPVYVRNMELREKYGIRSLCTSKHFIYLPRIFPNNRNGFVREPTYSIGWNTFRSKRCLIYDVAPIYWFISKQWNLENISYLSCVSILFIGNIKKAIYRVATIEELWRERASRLRL